MKIRAIRLQEVRRFSTGVALEGLSGGLDVLAGPNEAGKSTLLAGLRMALTEKHSAKGAKTVGTLKSASGGAPLVEIEFEADGKAYRLRKRFLSGAMAELRDLGGTQVWRNADADGKLDEVLAASNNGAALVWVDQGDFSVPEANTPLQSLIEAEAKSVSDGGAARRIRMLLDTELKTYVTTGRAQATGLYLGAQKALAEAQARSDAANLRRGAAQDRLQKLQQASADLATLLLPETADRRHRAVLDAQTALDQARAARTLADQAAAKEALAKEKHLRAADALQAFTTRTAELATIEISRAEIQVKSNLLTDQINTATAAQAELAAALALAAGELQAADVALAGVHAAQRAAVFAAMQTRAANADALAVQLRALDTAIAAETATAERVGAVRKASAEIDRIEARLLAISPDVSIAYLPGAEGRIARDGVPIAADTSWPVRARVELEIAGVGRITITPGLTEADATNEARLVTATTARDRGLAAMGATSLDEADARLHAHGERLSTRAGLDGQLRSLAPDGIAVLHDEVAALQRELPSSDAHAATLATPALTLASATAQRTAAALRHAAAQRAESAAREALQGRNLKASAVSAELKSNAARHTELSAALRDPAWRTSQLAGLTSDAEATRTAHQAAAQDLAVLRASRPDDERLQSLITALAATERAEQQAVGAVTALRGTVHHLQGELTRDQDEDIEAEAEALAAAADTARDAVAVMARDVAAMQRLAEAFAAEEAANKTTLFRPVLDRIAPYLAMVLPGATLDLGAAFAPVQLNRDTAADPMVRLSQGTQEQIAVLARLAFARLLSDRGQQTPLILDDALVYADDQRIEAMFGALRLASTHHQVIVLTCRERTFESLGGTRLRLMPWTAG